MKNFKKKLSILFASFALMMGIGLVGSKDADSVKAETVKDVLVNDDTVQATGTAYKAWDTETNNVTYESGASYIGNSAGSNGSIQLRSNNSNSGVVSKKSGGYIRSIEVTASSNTTNGRKLNFYAANTPFSSASALYGGLTTTGTLAVGPSITAKFDVVGDFEHFGIRSSSGAIYLDSITIEWEKPAAATLNSISVTPPTKLTGYNEGETLDTTGFKVEEVYGDGSTVDITNDTSKYTVTPALTTALVAGNNVFSVQHKDLASASSFTAEANARTLNRIEITQQPTKTRYFVGETLNTTGLVVTGKYSVGNDTDLTSACSFSPTTLDTTGEQAITVTHTSGNTTTFNVTVVAINSIAVTTMPEKTTYNEGSTLDTTGIVVEATCSDGLVETLTEGLSYSPTVLNTVGEQTITVTHTSGKTTTFDVTVVEVQHVLKNGNYIIEAGNYYLPTATEAIATPEAIAYNDNVGSDQAWTFTYISTIDGKDHYSISKNGLYLYATNTNNGVKIAEEGIGGPAKYTWEITESNGIYKLYTSANTQRALALYGTQDWRTYTSANGNKDISLISPKEQTGIKVTTAPDKVVYEAGDTFDSTGMVVEAVYDDGSTSPITDYTVTPETLTLGTTEVTITQTGTSFSTTQAVTVNEKVVKVLNELVVSGTLTNAPFNEGDNFSAAGLTVTARYLAGEEVIEEDVTSKVSWDIDNKILEANDTKAVASYTYEGVTKTVEVAFEVNAREVVSIEVTKEPNKMQYGIGEIFDPTGMEVTVTDNFGESAVITEGFTYTQDALVEGENVITIGYDGASTTLTVTAAVLPYYDAQFGGVKYSDSTYDMDKTINLSSQDWKGHGFNTNNGSWDYTRFGGKAASTESDPKSYIETTLTKDTNRVEIKFANNDTSVTGYKVTILSSDGTVVESFSLETTTEVITLNATNVSKWSEGSKFRLDIFKDSTDKNKGADLSYVKFYEATQTAVEKFIEDWRQMRADGGEEGICAFIGENDHTRMTELLQRFNEFSAEDQAIIRSAIDSGDVTIGKSIDYILLTQAWAKELVDVNSNAELNRVVLSTNAETTSLVALFAILGLVAVSAYYFIEKRKLAE